VDENWIGEIERGIITSALVTLPTA
jgi:hypothetical protein